MVAWLRSPSVGRVIANWQLLALRVLFQPGDLGIMGGQRSIAPNVRIGYEGGTTTDAASTSKGVERGIRGRMTATEREGNSEKYVNRWEVYAHSARICITTHLSPSGAAPCSLPTNPLQIRLSYYSPACKTCIKIQLFPVSFCVCTVFMRTMW